MPKNGHGSADPCAERTEPAFRRTAGQPKPATSSQMATPHMIPSRQKNALHPRTVPMPCPRHVRPAAQTTSAQSPHAEDRRTRKNSPVIRRGCFPYKLSKIGDDRSGSRAPHAKLRRKTDPRLSTPLGTAPYALPDVPIPPAVPFHPCPGCSPYRLRIDTISPPSFGKDAPQTKRKTFHTSCRRSFRCWHLSIVPGRFQPSIVDTSELNCRVRDGNGCTLTVIDTNYLRLSTADIFPLITGRYPEN